MTASPITAVPRGSTPGLRSVQDQGAADFLAMLSHELRNPPAPLGNSLFVLEPPRPGGQRARKAQAVISRQVTYLTHRREPSLAACCLVALSGHALSGEVQSAAEAGFDRHEATPLSFENLERLLADVAYCRGVRSP